MMEAPGETGQVQTSDPRLPLRSLSTPEGPRGRSPLLLLPGVSIRSSAVEKRGPFCLEKQRAEHSCTSSLCLSLPSTSWLTLSAGGLQVLAHGILVLPPPQMSLLGVISGSPGPCLWGGLWGWLHPPGAEQEPPCLVGLSASLS